MKSINKLVLLFLTQFAYTSLSANTVNSSYEIMPQFPGGEKAMHEFIAQKFHYPDEAKRAGIEGRVTTRFVVNEDGSISQAKVIRGIHLQCDSVALSIINQMPKWTPGKQNGKLVKVYFTLPIIFRLPEPNIVNGKPIYKNPKKPAEFPGGLEAMSNFISDNKPRPKPIRYQDGSDVRSARITIRFVVTKTGEIENITIIRSDREDLNDMATGIIKSMPKWIPAKHEEKNMDSYFTIPITFRGNYRPLPFFRQTDSISSTKSSYICSIIKK